MKTTLLSNVKNCKPPQKFRIRAKLKSFEPKSLYQSVKHCCPKCRILQEIPDDESLAHLFQDASTRPLNLNLHNDFWYKTAVGCTKNKQQIAFHFLVEDDWEKDAEKTSVMVERASLNEIFQLSRRFGNIIPVTSSEEQLTLLDLSAPFLIQGKTCYYGCKNCSNVTDVRPLRQFVQQESWEAATIAQSLGIQLLQHVFLVKLELDDGTACLDAILWQDAEKFFRSLASEAEVNVALQEKLERTMKTLCPPGKGFDELPWLDCCIMTYSTEDGVFNQIFDTVVAEETDILFNC
ncbi:UNVERIFIED_CONTAM: hypothetical protein FKN15_051868 [Acipenser sinensis]